MGQEGDVGQRDAGMWHGKGCRTTGEKCGAMGDVAW